MNVEPDLIVKLLAGAVLAGATIGTTIAVAKPLLARLTGAAAKAIKAKGEHDPGSRVAVAMERIVGVLERQDERLDNIDRRLDRIEAHHGIVPPRPSPPPQSATSARASIAGG